MFVLSFLFLGSYWGYLGYSYLKKICKEKVQVKNELSIQSEPVGDIEQIDQTILSGVEQSGNFGDGEKIDCENNFEQHLVAEKNFQERSVSILS